MAELNTIITLRQGTSVEWNNSKVILRVGEIGLEYLNDGSVKAKAGDGEHLWLALPYISDIDALKVEINGIQTAITDYVTRIGVLEQANISHSTEYNILNDIVSNHTQTIANKADIANVYTKSEIDVITGPLAEGKTLIDMINAAKTEATYDDTVIKVLIEAEETRAKKAESDLASELEKTNSAIAAIIENTDEEALNSIKELAYWINTHGAATEDMVKVIEANSNAINAINDKDTGILAIAKNYTNTTIANLPTATVDTLGLVKFDNTTIKMNESQQLHVAQVSTDVLNQGKFELVLNSGSSAI